MRNWETLYYSSTRVNAFSRCWLNRIRNERQQKFDNNGIIYLKMDILRTLILRSVFRIHHLLNTTEALLNLITLLLKGGTKKCTFSKTQDLKWDNHAKINFKISFMQFCWWEIRRTYQIKLSKYFQRPNRDLGEIRITSSF